MRLGCKGILNFRRVGLSPKNCQERPETNKIVKKLKLADACEMQNKIEISSRVGLHRRFCSAHHIIEIIGKKVLLADATGTQN